MIRDHFPITRAAWKRLKAAWADYRLASRQLRAHRKLNKLVARQRQSYECRRYRERRAAALKGCRP
jgi:hypothetical protein